MQNSNIESKINIDVKTGALILIDMLYDKKLINKETYMNIQSKYNSKNTNKITQSGWKIGFIYI
mgnify:CR=1 FL=1